MAAMSSGTSGTEVGHAVTVGVCPSLRELEGPRPQHVAEHVRGCTGCQLVDGLLALRSANDPLLCERVEDLIAVRDARSLPSEARAIIDAHAESCEPCRALAQTAHSISATIAEDLRSLPQVSPGVYMLGRELARGGMGRILEARDLRVGRSVAVKELLGSGSGLAARFEREARVTARLQHPGIVPIYEIGAWPDGTPFYSMRLIEGATLGASIAKAKTLDDRLALLPAIISAAEAVAFAHSRDIIHRDLTPANVMLGGFGETVVIDWGLAKDLTETAEDDVDVGPYRGAPTTTSELTAVGAVIGTAAYMPPEQAAGEQVDRRGDVYALGALLYQLLAGHAPFRGKTSEQVLAQLRAGAPPSVGSIVSGAPTDLVSIVDKAMARDRQNRYPSAAELVLELRRFQTGRIVEAHAYSSGELAWRWLKRHRALVIGAGVLIAALLGTGVLWYRAVESERTVAVSERDRAAAEERRTKERNVALLEEQGRQYLLAGDALRALAYLDEAMQQGADTPALRLVIGEAMHVVDRPRLSFGCDGRGFFTGRMANDGARVLVVCDELLRMFDVASRRVVFELAQPGLGMDPVVSEDSRWIAIGTDAAIVVDATTGALHRRVEHPHIVFPVGFHHDSAVFTSDDELLLVPLGDGPVQKIPFAAPRTEWSAFVSSFRGGVAVVGRGAGFETIDLAQRQSIARLPFRRADLVSFDVAPDGTRLVTCTPTGIRMQDVRTGRLEKLVAFGDGHDPPASCGLDAAGRRLVAALDNGTIEVFDLASGTRTQRFQVPPGVRDARFLDEYRAIAIVRSEVELEIRSDVSGQQLARLPIRGRLLEIRKNAVLTDGVNGVDLYALALDARSFDLDADHQSLGGDASATRLIARSPDGSYTIWNALSRERVLDLPAGMTPRLADDRVHLVATVGQDALAVIDTRDGSVRGRFTMKDIVNAGCDLTCKRVFATNGARTLVWDVATARQLSEHLGHAKGNAMSPDGRLVATRDDTSVTVWDATTGAKLVGAVHLGTTIGFDHASRYVLLHDGGRVEAIDVASKQWVLGTASSFASRDESLHLIGSFGNGRVSTFSFDSIVPVPIQRKFDSGRQFQMLRSAEVTAPQQSNYGLTPVPSSDGRFVASVSLDAMLEIRDATTGRVLVKLGEQPTHATPPQWRGADRVVGFGRGMTTWKLHHETRTAAEIHAVTASRIPWHFVDGELRARTGEIRGRVLDDGKPVEVRIRAHLLPSGGNFVTWSKPDGSFVLQDVPDGDVMVVANDTREWAGQITEQTRESTTPVLTRRGENVVLRMRAPTTTPLAPVPSHMLRSRLGSRSTSMMNFVNLRTTAVSVHWIDRSGKLSRGHTVPPGQITTQETYRGHVFLVRDADGKDLGVATGTMEPQRIEIR